MIQLQVLNKILQTKDASIITLNSLGPEYFPQYYNEFKFIKQHLTDYGCLPDIETFKNKFDKFNIIKVDEPVDYLLKELGRDKLKRQLVTEYNNLRPLLVSNNSDDVEKALLKIQQISENTTALTSLNCVNILTDKTRYEEYEDKTLNFNKYLITTGFKELDNLMAGWDAKEELASIVARTGKGKTWFLLRSATKALEAGYKVGFYSGEMTTSKLGYRVDTLLSHISNKALMHGNASVRNAYKTYINGMTEKYTNEFIVLTPRDLKRNATVSDIRAFIEKYNIDIMFIDQYSLMTDERGGKSDSERTGNIMMDLKSLQVQIQKPIISVSQQNREGTEDGKFDTTQIALSDKIGQYSTTVIFIERDGDLFKLHIIKARDGGEGNVFTYQVDLDAGIFRFIPGESAGAINNAEAQATYSDDEVFN